MMDYEEIPMAYTEKVRKAFNIWLMLFSVMLSVVLSNVVYAVDNKSRASKEYVASDEKLILINQLMELSGLTTQMASFPSRLKLSMSLAYADSPYPMPVGDYEDILATTLSVYDEKKLLADIRQYIYNNMKESEIITVISWLRSPLGNKISNLEGDSASADAVEMQKIAHKLYANQGRMEIIKTLNREVGAADVAVDISEYTQIAMMSSINLVLNIGAPTSVSELSKLVKDSRIRIRPMIEQQMILSLLYSYRNLSNNELGLYLNFARSKDAHQYHEVLNEGITLAIKNAIHDCHDAITRLLNAKFVPLT